MISSLTVDDLAARNIAAFNEPHNWPAAIAKRHQHWLNVMATRPRYRTSQGWTER
jgi:hypothetical protein